MLINHEKKILVWRPFKNYSSSLVAYLSRVSIFGKEKFMSTHGPVPFLVNDSKNSESMPTLGHTNWLPEQASNYIKLLPIRNPYDRVVSQWMWGLKKGGSYSFDDWLLIHSKQLIQFPVTKIYKYDHLIHVEDMENELRKFELFKEDHKFPHINKSAPIDDFQLTQKQKDMIYYLHYSDFVEGGYEK